MRHRKELARTAFKYATMARIQPKRTPPIAPSHPPPGRAKGEDADSGYGGEGKEEPQQGLAQNLPQRLHGRFGHRGHRGCLRGSRRWPAGCPVQGLNLLFVLGEAPRLEKDRFLQVDGGLKVLAELRCGHRSSRSLPGQRGGLTGFLIFAAAAPRGARRAGHPWALQGNTKNAVQGSPTQRKKQSSLHTNAREYVATILLPPLRGKQKYRIIPHAVRPNGRCVGGCSPAQACGCATTHRLPHFCFPGVL